MSTKFQVRALAQSVTSSPTPETRIEAVSVAAAPVRVQPDERPASIPHIRIQPARGWMALNLGELWAYRDLVVMLMMRDVKLRYKQTALGLIWVILQPLVASLIFAIIFGRFAGLPTGGVAYLPFVFVGMLPWNVFSGALQRAGNSLITDARLITKVYFPRIAIPIASSAAVLVDFAVALCVALVILPLSGIPLSLRLLTLPVLLAIVLLISVGVSFFFSALNVYYRDFMYALPFVVQVWMYASPVVYAADLVPAALRPVYALNPLVGVIDGFRWAMLGVGEFPAVSLALSLIVGIAAFIGGAFVFQRVESSFADVV